MDAEMFRRVELRTIEYETHRLGKIDSLQLRYPKSREDAAANNNQKTNR